MTSSTVSPEFAAEYALFERCNHTEIYQIARGAGHVVLPSLSRDALIRIIIGEVPPPPLPFHDVDETRIALMKFIIDHRKKLETQLTCPARSFKPDACFACVDAQVYSCLTSNGAENQRLILLHKKS
jgi:hypothetical protein